MHRFMNRYGLFPTYEMPVGKKENKFQKIPLRNVLLVTLRNDIK